MMQFGEYPQMMANPDGTIGDADRAMLTNLYHGISLTDTVIEVVVRAILRIARSPAFNPGRSISWLPGR
jgi:hypothetical protein